MYGYVKTFVRNISFYIFKLPYECIGTYVIRLISYIEVFVQDYKTSAIFSNTIPVLIFQKRLPF